MTEGLGAASTSDRSPHRGLRSVTLTPGAFLLRTGGVRRMAHELHDALTGAGWTVTVPGGVPAHDAEAATLRDFTLAHARLQLPRRVGTGTVTHAVYYDVPLWRTAPLVVTVHDMIHERFAIGSRRLRMAKRHAVRRADAVVCDSDQTRRDLIDAGLDPTRASVIPLGVSSAIVAGSDRADPFAGLPYVLYVGDRAGYKNFDLLVDALAAEPALDGFGLVAVGGSPMADEELTNIRRRRRGGEVLQLSAVGDGALGDLYRGASALVVTSRYEGFGLSVLEAMACGCPVASSRCGSLREFDGDLVEGFDPESARSCAAAVLAAIDTGAEDRRRAAAHAGEFTWERTATQYAARYEELGARP